MKFQLIPAIQTSERLLGRFALFFHSLIFSLAVPFVSNAQGFTITEGDTLSVTQSLDDDNSIGRIEDGAVLQTNGDSILSSGNGVQLVNYGEIETSDAYSVSFASSGNNVTVFNAGTGVSDGAFIVSSGDGLEFENSGYLESTLGRLNVGFPLSLGYTLYSSGSNATIRNSGVIQASGGPPDVIAILSEGDSATISNSLKGIINSNGAGVVTRGNGALVVNDGYIETQTNKIDFSGFPGGLNAPIHSSGIDVEVINSGELVASGISSDGIYSDGLRAMIRNSGSIRAGVPFQDINDASVGNGTGIFSKGASAEIFNSGTVSHVQIGIEAQGSNSRIVNSGRIEMAGAVTVFGSVNPGYGILAKGDDAQVIHSGTIIGRDAIPESLLNPPFPIAIPSTTTGIALDPFGNGNGTADVSGKILATSNAILGGGGEQVVNLHRGSQIVGAIDLGGGYDTVNIEAASSSASITLLNVENISLSSSVNGLAVGNTIHTIDPSAFSYQAQAVNSLVARMHGSMLRRLQQANAAGPIWVDASVSSVDAGGNDEMRSYGHDARTFNLGYEFDLGSGKAGVLAGYSDAEVGSDEVSFEDEISSFILGAYMRLPFESINLTTSLLLGHEEHDQTRFALDNMSGLVSYESEVDSYFISPSISIDTAVQMTEKLSIVPSGTLSCTLSYFEDYNESGGNAANFSIDERYLHIFSFIAEVAGVYEFNRGVCALAVGVDSRYSDESSIDATITGENLRISPVNDQSVSTGFLAARTSIQVSDRISVLGDVEHRFSGDEDEIFARLQLSGSF